MGKPYVSGLFTCYLLSDANFFFRWVVDAHKWFKVCFPASLETRDTLLITSRDPKSTSSTRCLDVRVMLSRGRRITILREARVSDITTAMIRRCRRLPENRSVGRSRGKPHVLGSNQLS